MRFSIVIPTWEQHGCGAIFLEQLLDSIKNQTFLDYEIIISDHSISDEIENLCKLKFCFLNINYFRNKEKRGNSPANVNNGLRMSSGEIIKVMFQDDFFINFDSLKIIDAFFKNNKPGWALNSFCHVNNNNTKKKYRYMTPVWNDKIIEGKNTIGCPSGLSFLNHDILFFEEELVYLMDCEYYYQLYNRYGLPHIIKDTLTATRIHKSQISSTRKRDSKKELEIIKRKHFA